MLRSSMRDQMIEWKNRCLDEEMNEVQNEQMRIKMNRWIQGWHNKNESFNERS